MSDFLRRHFDRQQREREADESTSSRLDEAMTAYSLVRSADVTEEPTDADQTSVASAQTAASYDTLGQTIANMLRAAENEAAQLLDSARTEAEAIREEAEREAEDARARFQKEIAENREEAERLREDAERYADKRRSDVEREAGEIRTEAQAHARKHRQEGKAAKRRLEAEGRERQQELAEASRLIEEGLRGTLAACREIVGRLEELVGQEPSELQETLLREAHELAGEPKTESTQ